MRFLALLIQAAAAVLVITAAPVPQVTAIADTAVGTKSTFLGSSAPADVRPDPPKRKRPNPAHDTATPNEALSTDGSETSSDLDLLNAIDSFDMAVKVTLAKPPQPDTNKVPANVMEQVLNKAAGLPAKSKQPVDLPTLSLAYGNFQAVVKKSFVRVQDTTRVPSAIALLQSASAAKTQYSTHLISGELDLTHVIAQGLLAPVTEVLAALGHSTARWYGVGKGVTAIPDLRLDVSSQPLAVVEIKTTESMPDVIANRIFNDFERFTMVLMPQKLKGNQAAAPDKMTKVSPAVSPVVSPADALTNKKTKPVPSLMHPLDIEHGKQYREERDKSTLILEQFLTQMWDTGAMLGAITNLETWLIVERFGNFGFKITKVSGVLPDGRSNGMNVLLAMSSRVLVMAD